MAEYSLKRKICIVITARASYARVRTVLCALRQKKDAELQIVLSGSAVLGRFGDIRKTLEADGLEITTTLHTVIEGENLLSSAKTTGLSIIELSSVFAQLRPDIVMTIADRYETIATAIAASYLNIPLAHLQGGEVTGNIDEKVRHAITKLSDIHFVATQRAKEYVCRMGENEENVFLTGCPSIDIAKDVLENSSNLNVDLIQKYGGVGPYLTLPEKYFVVMKHPTTDECGSEIQKTKLLLKIMEEMGGAVIWFWPNIDSGSDYVSSAIRRTREKNKALNIHFIKNMQPEDFLSLLIRSEAIIGNSSVGIRECSYLGVPSINIGERQRDRERATNVIEAQFDYHSIVEALDKVKQMDRTNLSNTLYGNGDAGSRIADLLLTVPLTYRKCLNYVTN